jgi:hypothetical protein
VPVVSERQRRYLAAVHPDVLRAFTREAEQLGFRPPEDVARVAKRGLALRRKHGRGGTLIGARRASQLANRSVLSVETLRRMKAYFDRHEIDLKAPAAKPGNPGYPSAGLIAWYLWGGTAGRRYAERILRVYEKTKQEKAE